MQINLRFITLNSIIHDNLMPWLEENKDQEKFRLILRKMSPMHNGEHGSFFHALISAFSGMGIRSGRILTDEFNLLSQVYVTPEIKDSSSPFNNLDDDNPKIIFYTSLISHSVPAYLSYLQNAVTADQSTSLRKHSMMGVMKTISDMIIQTRALSPAGSADRIIINRLLAGLTVLFSETVKLYPHEYEPLMLRISNADIRNFITGTENDDKNNGTLFSLLAAKYFPLKDSNPATPLPALPAEQQKGTLLQQNEPSCQQNPDEDILNEVAQIKEDLSGLVNAVKGAIKKKEVQPDTDDRLIGSSEVCKLLHISKSTLKAHRDKKLYSFTKIGSRYLYSAKEINEILRLNKGN